MTATDWQPGDPLYPEMPFQRPVFSREEIQQRVSAYFCRLMLPRCVCAATTATTRRWQSPTLPVERRL